ncbi:hypothetical protein VB712_03555 [Spirulina sp. CCNP1310]|uniref:P-loop ATPase, Sll1717 family n=1 Tax=Spirulina sp. CCNP1310 TaxID=3110249 RepID=UPI002B1FCAD1|nr:hypothetical protein [Spirulina sp. CCNP1310]MEA5418287.1 hypothetical protein [Spirulina sp. CCNP1310]
MDTESNPSDSIEKKQMNHSEIKAKITENMSSAHLEIEDLRIQLDQNVGWRIAVISPDFNHKTRSERQKIVLNGLEALTIQWLDLLTPEEKEWAGSLPLDAPIENLPLWPEALARPSHPETILFASDLEDDLKRPIIATFYSLRGGVGRSTALAYTAQILANHGRTVLCVDMDLEAPGLAALFGKENEVQPEQGLIFSLLSLDQGEHPDLRNQIIRISETEELYCLPAGLPNANYARVLNLINPEAWYREDRNPLRELIDILSTELPFKPDVILLDARTGITPLNGPLLFDLADLAIIVFFPHPQTQVGTGALVQALLASHNRRTEPNLTPEPRFIVSPIPASQAPEVIERYRHRSLGWINNWLGSLSDKRPNFEPMVESEITHFIPYRETIATSDRILSAPEYWRDFEPVAEWIEGLLPMASEQQSFVNLAHEKAQILQELQFSGAAAEAQNHLLETFVETDLVQRAIRPDMPLVLGRKGTGKTAIFRRLLEDDQYPSIVVLSPSPLKDGRFWVLSPEAFKEVDQQLKQHQKSWREFWLLQVCLACHLSWQAAPPEPDDALMDILANPLTKELDFINCIENSLSKPRLGLLLHDWLMRFDRDISVQTFLLIDGLDTGFGVGLQEQHIRTESISSLLSLVNDLESNLHRLKFKVMLREDIWRRLKFDNKSHFYGRSVSLQWLEPVDFFKVIVKTALQSHRFKALVQSIEEQQNQGRFLFSSDDFHLTEQQVWNIWNLLVGERMRGGKSAFTKNWVWKRIADGSNHHSPRALLQLFKQGQAWEMREQTKNAYGKTVIRPKALIASLEEVSKQTLDALIEEEFPNLSTLVERLREIGRSPFKSSEVEGLEDELRLASEVGLLSIYEGTNDVVERYKVPDLYRSGIGMTRKGQA